MDLEKFTERSRGFIESAQGLAKRSNHQLLTPEHLLKILLDDEQGLASSLIQTAGGRASEARQQTEMALAKIPKVQGAGGQVYLAPEAAKVLDQAAERRGLDLGTGRFRDLRHALGVAQAAWYVSVVPVTELARRGRMKS